MNNGKTFTYRELFCTGILRRKKPFLVSVLLLRRAHTCTDTWSCSYQEQVRAVRVPHLIPGRTALLKGFLGPNTEVDFWHCLSSLLCAAQSCRHAGLGWAAELQTQRIVLRVGRNSAALFSIGSLDPKIHVATCCS